MYRSLLLALSILFIITSTKAAVFVVTSNADSGPGTLREALTLAAANGSAEKDYINFNLPDLSEAGRTIRVILQLPDLTSNLVIDASTQPGSKFGVTDSKIKISTAFKYPDNLTSFHCQGADFIEIYGIWFDCDISAWGGPAIDIKNFNTLVIGMPGKGNFFERGNININIGKKCSFQSNICWTDITGEIARSGAMSIFDCDNVVIGGSANAKNVIAGITQLFFSNPNGNSLDLSYNIMGTNYTGTKAPYGFNLIDQTRVSITGPYGTNGMPLNVPLNAVIKDNIIADVYGYDLLEIGALGGKIIIQGNAFNTDYDGKLNFNEFSQSIAEYAIGLGVDAEVIIGGDDPSQKNLIAYVEDGIGYDPHGKYKITRNSIFCVGENSFVGYIDGDLLPQVKITSVSPTLVSGTATPNAVIELFKADCACATPPNPKTYFATINADANGKWSYNGVVDSYVMASATFNNLTGYFTGLNIDDSKATITSATCNNKGSITGIVTPYSTGFRWYDNNNKLISTNLDLKDVDAGTYTLKIAFGTACEQTKTFTIEDKSVKINADNLQITRPSCGTKGSITGITVAPYDAHYKWTDKNGVILCNCVDLYDVSAGTYTFTVENADGSCKQTSGPYLLKNTDGINIDDSKSKIINTNCGQSIGSITNLTVTGSGVLHYSWRDDQNQEVAQTKDLTGKAGGKYTLHVTDDTQCGEVISSTFEIKTEGAIVLDESAKTIQPATCQYDNGGIKGITAPGATIYKWYNVNNQPVSDNLDLDGVAPGSYYLVASNANGCSAKSTTFTIERTPRSIIGNTKVIKNATCDENNGSITIIFQQQPAPVAKSFRWVNHTTGASVTTTDPELKGLDAASYDIYVTEQSGCEYLLASYTVNRDVGLTVTADNVQVNDDHCETSTGSIKGIYAAGATPLSFVWTDDHDNIVGNAPNLENVIAGTYHIKITDGSGCTQGLVYSVNDKTEAVNPPSVTNLDLCTAGNALLVVNNANSNYSYRLYDDANSPAPLSEQQNGRFAVNVPTDRSYYISQFKGNCESARVEIKIKVGISSINIANTFSPNGDGHNDYWKINGIESYPQAVVQVFNRNGQKLFESKGYGTPFNGTYNGKTLPVGTYFYIINLNKNCNLLSGSLTIIR
ncbi:gliding motility-associated C-terminal domain-containing protein [Mucilaginibacter flavus]|uniref:gliding motility-associated C-terminal domain-containing protein n=1 Tax=Mucilaginibacter flavus TaxID=931504 RepID=UPI0025B336A4|nr:gliding motility-associated C-terminal domain-containing protein [Mucilaginibacter flavus]MDN3581565.1 gliding motility-associated C-terminal domain-containing protein [Mucilaginibacter flavus]